MATKRVFEIAKEQGLSSREVVTRLKEAGLDVSAGASTVGEAEALKVLANGSGPAVEEKPPRSTRRRAPKPKAEIKPKAEEPAPPPVVEEPVAAPEPEPEVTKPARAKAPKVVEPTPEPVVQAEPPAAEPPASEPAPTVAPPVEAP